jgi:hypothetical protein
MTTQHPKLTDRQKTVLATVLQLAIAVESIGFAVEWLANDSRSKELNGELITVKALAAQALEDLRRLQARIWTEFGAPDVSAPAND